ncbi:MAG: hypothetical protein HY402_03090, partial [Elusimicrobia bacterium]|nr:hypothetical protein [Elusimicrobiota bacterium]
MKKAPPRLWWTLCCLVICVPAVKGQKRDVAFSRVLQPETDLVDIPTAGILDYGSVGTRVRFFSEGGTLGYLSFGVLQRLNIGASLNVDRFIGNVGAVDVQRPEIQLRLRFYDGSRFLPALALGFDSQGYLFDSRRTEDYLQKEHGLYLVASREIGLPGLQGHAGGNIADFDNDFLAAFFGVSYWVEDVFSLMAEWDNLRGVAESRVNAGARFYVTPFFNFDFAVRGIGR